jgi:hypothetical protein
MTAALCLILGFFAGAVTGVVILLIAGNKVITKQIMAEHTKLDAELVRTKERISVEKRKRLQMLHDRSGRGVGYHDTLGRV